MKITEIFIENFLGIKKAHLQPKAPITLFAGANGSGKSSAQEAVRMALIGHTARVKLKKEYSQLVNDSATLNVGSVVITVDGKNVAINLPSGKQSSTSQYVAPAGLAYVLDAQNFARLDLNERRSFLFGLMGCRTDAPTIKNLLLGKNCNPEKVEQIAPLLRSGFEAASKEAAIQAREAKAEWRTITGETYGEVKALQWRALKPAFNEALMRTLKHGLSAIETALQTQNQMIGELRQKEAERTEIIKKLPSLRECASQYARIQEKLNHDEESLKEWELKIASLPDKNPAASRKSALCPGCGLHLAVSSNGELSRHSSNAEQQLDNETQKLKIPEYMNALSLLKKSVENDRRDLNAANAAAVLIESFEKRLMELTDEVVAIKPNGTDFDAKIKELTSEKERITKDLKSQETAEDYVKNADLLTQNAVLAHADVVEWSQIADQLAPDGIPDEILKTAITPINEHLKLSAEFAQWGCVVITSEMQLLLGDRPYALLSESEQWRVDAMIAEAISALSGLKILLLDRMDVLDLKGRSDLMYWLEELAATGELETTLISGTLKSSPVNLSQLVGVFWVENGLISEVDRREAA